MKLADCATHLYALESAVYMTAGLADFQVEIKNIRIRLGTPACLRKYDYQLGDHKYLENSPGTKNLEL